MNIEALENDLRRILRRGGTIQVRPAATALPTATPITSITDDGGGTATVVATGHGLSTSDEVVVFGAYQARFNGTKTVTVTDANTFTYSVSGSVASTATGRASVVKKEALPSGERFYSLGSLRSASVRSEANSTAKSTGGKAHILGSDFTISAVMQQTSDAEVQATEDLTQQFLDVAIFSKGCHEQHADKAELVAALHNGFLVYGAKLSVGGDFDLQGGESGLEIESQFYVGIDHSEIVVGE